MRKTDKLMRILMGVCCMVLMLTALNGHWEEMSGAHAEGITAGTNDLDGSKIEGIKLVWVTEDSTTTAEGTPTAQEELDDTRHLYLSTTSTNEISMTYKIEVEFSGQYDYAPGDITITIPAKVWHARKYVPQEGSDRTVGVVDENAYIGSMELSVPAYPSTKADFNYQLIDGNYVLTNTRTIGATSSVSIEASICGLLPMEVVDMSECDDIVARCEVVTNQGNIIENSSTPINAQIDTQAKITSAQKSGTLYESYSNANIPEALLANLPEGSTPDDYVYVCWTTYPSQKTTSPIPWT